MKKSVLLLCLVIMLTLSLFSCEGNILDEGTSSSGMPSEVDSSLMDESVDDSGVTSTPAMSEKLPSDSDDSVPKAEKKSIVVLGDSIARGYGLRDVEKQRFSSLLSEQLKKVYSDVSVANYGIDGQTGSELLTLLQATPPTELADCDYVIISIGGNNILQAIKSLTSVADEIGKVNTDVFRDYFIYLFAEDEAVRQKYSYSCGVLNELFKTVNKAFDGEEFNAVIDKAEEDLRSEIPMIVSEIKKINKNAEIYIQTVYNPYKNITVSLDGVEETLDLSTRGDKAVSKLNIPIVSLAKDNGYTVAPVYERFARSKKPLTNARFDATEANFNIDPHPDANGHIIIADIYFKLLTEAQND